MVLCDRVILVVGHRADELISRYANHPRIRLVHNHDYAQGLGSSIRAGLAACSSDHLFISHGDLPCIPPEVYRTLWQARGDETLFPSYQGEAGHPVLLPRALARALVAAPDYLVCDEATTMLDPLTTASITRLIRAEVERRGIVWRWRDQGWSKPVA